MTGVTLVFRVSPETIFKSVRGRGQDNLARSATLYVAHKTTAMPLTDIARYFGLSHYGKEDESLAKAAEQVMKNINK